MERYDTVRRYADAWSANDIAAVVDLYSENFVLLYFGDGPLAGDDVGKDAALAALVEATQGSGRQLDEIEELTVSIFGTIVAPEGVRDPSAGDEGSQALRVIRRVFLYEVRDGKLVECWLYDEDQGAIDELWRTVTRDELAG